MESIVLKQSIQDIESVVCVDAILIKYMINCLCWSNPYKAKWVMVAFYSAFLNNH